VEGIPVKNRKLNIAATVGIASFLVGACLRLAARDIAWPGNYSFSEPREYTVWAMREHAYQDIGLAFLGFGLVVILIVLIKWLWTPASAN
jgi:hypothetical protein